MSPAHSPVFLPRLLPSPHAMLSSFSILFSHSAHRIHSHVDLELRFWDGGEGGGQVLPQWTLFLWRRRAVGEGGYGAHSGTWSGKVWVGQLGEDSSEGAAGQSLARPGLRPAATLKALGREGGLASWPTGRRAVGAGLPANSLKCVGERGKEERISSQQPRHLVEGPSEDTDQITNTRPGQHGQSAGRTPRAGTAADNCCGGSGLPTGR